MKNQTENRKDEHVRVALEEDVFAAYNSWDDITLKHNALPEINKEDVDLSTQFLNVHFEAPIIISAMTGGYNGGKTINKNLAEAASHYQIGMGVGSQRAALEKPELSETYSVIKDYDIPMRVANIGASQLVLWKRENILDYAHKMIDMIDANSFAICLNFLQEVVQSEGEAEAKGCLDAISYLADNLPVPVIVKESGAGIRYDVAERLSQTKISAIDVGGAGGTSFASIEHHRANMIYDSLHARGGKTFWNWGIPTPISILETGEATNWEMPIIATGGIRNGLDAAKALVLGADMAGVAHLVLKPATEGKKETLFEVDCLIKELRAAMFLLGCSNVLELCDVEVGLV